MGDFEERKKENESAFKIRNSPENVSLEDVKRGFKQLDVKSQIKYMTDLFRSKGNVEIEEWLTKNYSELSLIICRKLMTED